jgi:hypothetical protein
VDNSEVRTAASQFPITTALEFPEWTVQRSLGMTFGVVVRSMGAAKGLTVRRHGESDAPQPGWAPTDEVFKDPGTDRTMRVRVDRSGERHYVPEAR